MNTIEIKDVKYHVIRRIEVFTEEWIKEYTEKMEEIYDDFFLLRNTNGKKTHYLACREIPDADVEYLKEKVCNNGQIERNDQDHHE